MIVQMVNSRNKQSLIYAIKSFLVEIPVLLLTKFSAFLIKTIVVRLTLKNLCLPQIWLVQAQQKKNWHGLLRYNIILWILYLFPPYSKTLVKLLSLNLDLFIYRCMIKMTVEPLSYRKWPISLEHCTTWKA